MILEIGKEYLDIQRDFMTKRVTKTTKLLYMGLHPYDQRHMFAIHPAGGCYAVDGNEFIKNLQVSA